MNDFSVNLGRAKGRRTLDKVEGFTTVIGEDTEFMGSIRGKGSCIVHGRVEADCDIEGALVLGATGHWVGSITAGCVLIAGSVDGNVTSTGKMEIVSTARINGKIESSVLAIAEGAIHEGEIKMSSSNEVTRFKDRRASRLTEKL